MNESFMTCIIVIVGKLGGINMTVSVQTQKIKNFIGGKWKDANTAEYHDVPNPATGKSLAQVPISTSEDVNDAVKAAKAAFKTWSKMPVPKRARILFKYQQLLTDNQDRKSTRLNSSHVAISYAVFCLKKK